MALAVAQTDSSALLAITANVPTAQFNRGPFQELNRHNQADFPNVIRPVVKRSFQPSRVDMLPLAMRQAVTTMTSGRPGPVNLDIPFNLFQEEAEVELEASWDGFNERRSGASPARRLTAAATATGSRGSKYSAASPQTSGTAPASAAGTGQPSAMASSGGRPKPS